MYSLLLGLLQKVAPCCTTYGTLVKSTFTWMVLWTAECHILGKRKSYFDSYREKTCVRARAAISSHGIIRPFFRPFFKVILVSGTWTCCITDFFHDPWKQNYKWRHNGYCKTVLFLIQQMLFWISCMNILGSVWSPIDIENVFRAVIWPTLSPFTVWTTEKVSVVCFIRLSHSSKWTCYIGTVVRVIFTDVP